MKKNMFLSLVILALAISLWTPTTPAVAKNVEGQSSTKVGYEITPVSFITTDYSLDPNFDLALPAAAVRVLVVNNTGGVLRINLTGPRAYSFALGRGRKYIAVAAGTYRYQVTARCGHASGRIRITAGKIWTWYCR